VGGLMSSNIRIVIIIITCWLFGAIVIRRADGRRQKIRWQSAGIPVEEISARVSGERGGVMEFLTIVKVKEDSKIKKWNKQSKQTERKEKKKDGEGRGVERQRKTERKNTLSYGDSTKSC
jgi:hypothetical protein